MYYIKNDKRRIRVRIWIRAWVEIAQAIIIILTLGFIHPSWDFEMVIKGAKKDCEMAQKKFDKKSEK